jgi:hypothetical protein
MNNYIVITLTGVCLGAVFAKSLENAVVTAEELFGSWRLVFPLGGQ